MEVITINNNNYSIPNLELNKNIRMPAAEGNSVPANITGRSEFNYDDVMMNLEDVKNFLFMLIGGNLAKITAADIKGKNVNTTA